MNITITRYEPVQVPVALRDFPALERLTHFSAVQRGPDEGYQVEMEFQWQGGARYGVDIPITDDPYDLAYLVYWEHEWLRIADDTPIAPGSDWLLGHLGPSIRQFVDIHYLERMRGDAPKEQP